MLFPQVAAGLAVIPALFSAGASAAAIDKSKTTDLSIKIDSAYFATRNVTPKARQNLKVGNNIHFMIPGVGEALGGYEWPHRPIRQLNILYHLSNDTSTKYIYQDVWSPGTIPTDNITVTPTKGYDIFTDGTDSGKEMYDTATLRVAPIAKPAGAKIEIVGAAWGGFQVKKGVYTKLYNHAASGKNFTFSADFFNSPENESRNFVKVGVVWYMQNGVLKALSGEEGKSYHF